MSVEWYVGYFDENKTLHTARDGAQTIFGLENAKKLAKKQGAPWEVIHSGSLLSLKEHEKLPQSQQFGTQWAP